MPLAQFLVATFLALPCLIPDEQATIRGTVVNGSQADSTVADAEVILQVQQDGSFIPLAQTISDDQGQFVFTQLPVSEHVYLVGATRDGVFHPAERVRLVPDHPEAKITVRVFDAVTQPSPLIARRHHIVIRAEPNSLHVTETISISNPSTYCYVGLEQKRQVTLQLHIPDNFERVTFQKEFYGRRFALIDGELVTTIPWPPGERELEFTYILPIEKRQQCWERPLDLDCSDVHISVVGHASHAACNLERGAIDAIDRVSFGSRGEMLPAGHVLRVELNRLPVSFSVYARWVALGVLTGVIAVSVLALWIRSNRARSEVHCDKPTFRKVAQRHIRPKTRCS